MMLKAAKLVMKTQFFINGKDVSSPKLGGGLEGLGGNPIVLFLIFFYYYYYLSYARNPGSEKKITQNELPEADMLLLVSFKLMCVCAYMCLLIFVL